MIQEAGEAKEKVPDLKRALIKNVPILKRTLSRFGAPPPESLLRLDSGLVSQKPKNARRYTVRIDRSDGGPLGVVTGKDHGEALVVCHVNGGLATEWNHAVAERVRIKPGDRIDSVNGITGNKDLMEAQLQRSIPLIISLTEPVITRMHGRSPLGLGFHERKDGATLAISEIEFGCVLAWNLKYPHLAVAANDHLIQVDQMKGSVMELETGLRECESWDLSFRRYSTTPS